MLVRGGRGDEERETEGEEVKREERGKRGRMGE